MRDDTLPTSSLIETTLTYNSQGGTTINDQGGYRYNTIPVITTLYVAYSSNEHVY